MTAPWREKAEAIVREAWPRAFLRCDRGGGLYVTNAPLAGAQLAALEEAGFRAEPMGSLWRLFPGEALTREIDAWLSQEGDPLRLPALSGVREADCALLCEGLKRLELPADEAALARYEKRLRQRAAECMRTRQGGGLLSLCGRLLLKIRKERNL